ncbi:MAG: VanZ family protein [Myxococcota bacterium]|nr:VanZ family protein [Myxococcota bacterium]
MTDANLRRAARAWLPVIAWAALIWHLGGDDFGTSQSDGVLGPLLKRLLPWISPEGHVFALWLIRRSAHPAVYAVLALLAWRACSHTSPGLGAARQTALTLALVSSLAGADEYRQAGSAVREGHSSDVALDVVGAALALGARAAWESGRRRGKPAAKPRA